MTDTGFATAFIRGAEAGRRRQESRQQLEAEEEDRKLRRDLHKFHIKRLDLEGKLAERKSAEEEYKFLSGLPARNASQAGSPALGEGEAGPAPEEVQVNHPSVLIPSATGGAGIRMTPPTMEELLVQHIAQKRAEARAGDVPVTGKLAEDLLLDPGMHPPSVVAAAGTVAGQRRAASTADANRTSADRRAAGSNAARIQAAQIAASRPQVQVIQTGTGPQLLDKRTGTTGPITDRGTGATVQAAPTAAMRDKVEARKLVRKSIDPVQALSAKLITKRGIAQRAVALGRSVESALGHDPEYRTYQDVRMSLAGNLAVGQQGSRPSDADIRAIWLPLIPDTFRDTDESAAMKWQLIRTMSDVDEGGAAGAGSEATHVYNPATGQIEPVGARK